MAINPEVTMTLDDSVAEVLGLLTGLDLEYHSSMDRYRSITRQLNRALRATALENEWEYYASTLEVGNAQEGQNQVNILSSRRLRRVNDDAVRLVDDEGDVRQWAYFLPSDAGHKYGFRGGLWCYLQGQGTLVFSRPFTADEDGLRILVPAMREPIMFRLPESGEEADESTREQEIDFAYPDLVIARAAYFYAQADPVMQPRVQQLEMDYKTLMYQLIERDLRHTDAPYMNDFTLPVQNGLRKSMGGNRPPFANH